MRDYLRMAKIGLNYATYAFAGLGVVAALAAVLSPLFIIPDTLGYDNRSGRVAVNTRRWLLKNYQPTDETISTALLGVKRNTFPIHDINSEVAQKQGTIVGDPTKPRVLLADRTGAFFEIDLASDKPVVTKLPIGLQLREDELLKFAAGRGTVENSLMRVWRLVFLDGQRLAASYTQWDDAQKCATLNVAIHDFPDDWRPTEKSGDWRVIYKSQPCLPLHLDGGRLFAGHQAGGRMVLSAPDKLVLTVGDFQYDGVNFKPAYPQDDAVDYGKVFEIDVKTGAKKVLSKGHRNSQGLAQDAQGRIWETEHGAQGGDELNQIVAGANYGWPNVTLGTEYGTFSWPLSSTQGRHDGYQAPTYAWVPSIGVSNLIAVRGFAPVWDGDLLVCSLTGNALFRVRLDGDKVTYVEPITMGDRLRDITQLNDGRIALWTDTADLIVLAPGSTVTKAEQLLAAASPKVREVVDACLQCHTMEDGAGASGKINLLNIHGRRIASGPAELYSEAMSAQAGTWDERALDEFLKDPQKKVPGTAMVFPGVPDDKLRREVVEFLRGAK